MLTENYLVPDKSDTQVKDKSDTQVQDNCLSILDSLELYNWNYFDFSAGPPRFLERSGVVFFSFIYYRFPLIYFVFLSFVVVFLKLKYDISSILSNKCLSLIQGI